MIISEEAKEKCADCGDSGIIFFGDETLMCLNCNNPEPPYNKEQPSMIISKETKENEKEKMLLNFKGSSGSAKVVSFKIGFDKGMEAAEKILAPQIELIHDALVMVKSLCCCTDCHEVANNAIAKYEEMREKK